MCQSYELTFARHKSLFEVILYQTRYSYLSAWRYNRKNFVPQRRSSTKILVQMKRSVVISVNKALNTRTLASELQGHRTINCIMGIGIWPSKTSCASPKGKTPNKTPRVLCGSKGLDPDCFLGGQSFESFTKEQQSLLQSMEQQRQVTKTLKTHI